MGIIWRGPYEQGKDAYLCNETCPYSIGSEGEAQWYEGFDAARDADTPYEQGKQAAYDATNPYRRGTLDYDDWESGWSAGED